MLSRHKDKSEVPDIIHEVLHQIRQEKRENVHALNQKLEKEKEILTSLTRVL